MKIKKPLLIVINIIILGALTYLMVSNHNDHESWEQFRGNNGEADLEIQS